ncbi:homeobox protein cut-like 1 isoform X2 [Triticum aestivum]|uniref:homeobox protein cut-like 1 isoform X2 n=1 Tax=Triticum aestivum TaxID=4565 RepID=UPI001D034881|nr:homeobox protein cut-like 1 isoform X2 [Triticum aestivum]
MNRVRAAAQREQHGLHLPGPCLPSSSTSFAASLPGTAQQQSRQGRPGPGPGRGYHGGPRNGRPLRRPGCHRHRQVRLQQAPSGSQRRRLRRGPVVNVNPQTTTSPSTSSTASTSRSSSPVLAHICRDGIQQWKNCWQDGMLGSNCGVGCWQVTGLEQRNLMRCSKLRWSWSLTRC